jgi:hypothetical protein
MQTVRSEIFARILIFPNHFERDKISLECFYPRPIEKDGISVCKCSEIELTELKRLGEQIAERQKQTTIITEFKGILFFLAQSANGVFDYQQTGHKKYHYTIKHKSVNYQNKPFQPTPDIIADHRVLLNESLFLSKNEIDELLTTYDEANDISRWNIIYKNLLT